MAIQTTHEPERRRYVLRDEGAELGEMTYRDDGGRLVIDHTGIDPARRGEGLGERLVGDALADLRDASETRVEATCPFVVRYLSEHPEFAELATR